MIENLINIAKQAGKILMKHYNKEVIEVKYKQDSSPVSIADLESNSFICQQLANLYPQIAIISEENINPNLNFNRFWLIDPLDGTKSFLKKDGEFTVNIALIENNVPILGVVYAPLSDQLYYTDINRISYKKLGNKKAQQIQARTPQNEGYIVVVSSSSINNDKLNQFLHNKKIDKIIPISSSLKICMIAEGLADIYPRFGQTMEWDTAAAHAILTAAGGSVKDLDGKPLRYGNSNQQYYNPEFISMGKT